MPLGKYAVTSPRHRESPIDHRIPQSSYYDKYNRPTAALYRARQPYIVKNALTGLAIFGFAIGVCSSHPPLLYLSGPV